MKGKIVFLWLFLFLSTYGVAFGDGSGLPVPPLAPNPENIVGGYVRGFFTAAVDQLNPNQYSHHNIHVVLEWAKTAEGEVKGIDKGTEGRILLKRFAKPQIPAKKVHLFSAEVVKPNSGNLCNWNAETLRDAYQFLPEHLNVARAFGVPKGKAYITELKILNKDFCGDLSKAEQKAMIHGEVEILIYIE